MTDVRTGLRPEDVVSLQWWPKFTTRHGAFSVHVRKHDNWKLQSRTALMLVTNSADSGLMADDWPHQSRAAMLVTKSDDDGPIADDNQSYRDYGLIAHYALTSVDYRPPTDFTPDYCGNTITSSLDISRVSTWLQVCEATHDHELRAEGHTRVRDIFPSLQFLRLVDVQDRCLVEVDL